MAYIFSIRNRLVGMYPFSSLVLRCLSHPGEKHSVQMFCLQSIQSCFSICSLNIAMWGSGNTRLSRFSAMCTSQLQLRHMLWFGAMHSSVVGCGNQWFLIFGLTCA